MEINIDFIKRDQTNLLGKGAILPWENSMRMQFEMWREYYNDGTIDKLMNLCNTDKVYGLFCYRCDMENQTFSYHIVCENITQVKSEEFEEFTLYPAEYARFKTSSDSEFENRHVFYNQLCDEIWKEWLPKSGYLSLIEPDNTFCNYYI